MGTALISLNIELKQDGRTVCCNHTDVMAEGGGGRGDILISDFAILTQKWSKIAKLKKAIFLVFANHPVVHSGGVSRGRVRGCDCWR